MDSQRSEWNDRALDQLDGRVENLERDVDDLRADLRERPTPEIPWTTIIGAVATIVVPIAVAFIYGWFQLKGMPVK